MSTDNRVWTIEVNTNGETATIQTRAGVTDTEIHVMASHLITLLDGEQDWIRISRPRSGADIGETYEY